MEVLAVVTYLPASLLCIKYPDSSALFDWPN